MRMKFLWSIGNLVCLEYRLFSCILNGPYLIGFDIFSNWLARQKRCIWFQKKDFSVYSNKNLISSAIYFLNSRLRTGPIFIPLMPVVSKTKNLSFTIWYCFTFFFIFFFIFVFYIIISVVVLFMLTSSSLH